MEKNFTLEAVGEFPFTFLIEKAIPTEKDGELIIEGIASTTNIDHDNERMSKDALRAMESAINEKSVPLRIEHDKSASAVIGRVFKGWVDERNQLHIQASLDKSHPISSLLHDSMKQGAKMGLSVGGIVKRAVKEFAESVGKMVKTFYDVQLNEVSVTPRPANYDAYVMAKSIAKDESEAENFRNTGFYDEFLFQNPQLDYLQMFAKSVPDKAWRKTVVSPEVNNNKDMNKDMNKDTKKKEDDKEEDTTDKAVSRGEFEALKSLIEKGFTSIGGLISKAMGDDSAKDTSNPDKKKPVEEGDKAQKKMDGDAEDENNPDKKKPKDVGDKSQKSEESDGTDENGEREKTKKKEKEDTEDYKLDTVERSISTIDALTKRLNGVKKSEDTEDDTKKAEDKEDEEDTKKNDSKDEDETTKGIHPLDQFVKAVTKAMEAVVGRMEKSGKTVLGFEKSIVDTIKNDPVLQEEIAKMMKIPGLKRSVVMGTPMMITKDGKRYSLSATELGATVEKSQGRDDLKGKSFKEVYQTRFSSVKSQEE